MREQSCKLWLTLAAALFLITVNLASAQEHIISYHSDIDIAEDGSIVVSETIRVQAEGSEIQRGIFRDFPTDYRDRLGNHYIVEFEVLGVTRDGLSEPWRSERRGNGVRVYIGSENIFLQPGEYSYLIRYQTDRQIGFFEQHDELYWNVTGNGWSFSILSASATVHLPANVAASDLSMAGFTGYAGSTAQTYTSSVSDGSGQIATTATLAPRQGLTLVMGWPKGIVTEPGNIQKAGYLLFDNRGLLLMLLALLFSFFYLYKSWSIAGRDPEAGVIFPRYAPPKAYSPASTRYISKMGYDQKAFSAGIINLAVKKHLSISKVDKEYTLIKADSDEALAPGEQALIEELFSEGKALLLDNENRLIVSRAKKAHKSALDKDYNNIYFNLNAALLLPSLFASITMLIIVVVIGAMTPLTGIVFAIIVLMHAVFLFLMRAPSIKGRLLLDKLQGFKQYLEVAEQDDLDLKNPPDKTPELFENYLPYALALGVEQAWAEQFTAVFAALEAKEGRDYHPVWYHGIFHSSNIRDFTQDIGSSFNSAISAASTAPGTTSGGGGFSGGGGGGGGGGGW